MVQPFNTDAFSNSSRLSSDDQALGRRVRSYLFSALAEAEAAIAVEVQQGRVVLWGRASSPSVKVLAELRARRVAGVRQVVNQLRVSQRASGRRNQARVRRPVDAHYQSARTSGERAGAVSRQSPQEVEV